MPFRHVCRTWGFYASTSPHIFHLQLFLFLFCFVVSSYASPSVTFYWIVPSTSAYIASSLSASTFVVSLSASLLLLLTNSSIFCVASSPASTSVSALGLHYCFFIFLFCLFASYSDSVPFIILSCSFTSSASYSAVSSSDASPCIVTWTLMPNGTIRLLSVLKHLKVIQTKV
jgi:hypothetical protein